MHITIPNSRISQETNESSKTLESEATVRAGSSTKRPFLPTDSGIYRTFPDVRRLRLVRSPNANETGRSRTNSLYENYLHFR